MVRISKSKVIGNGEKQCNGECGKIKPYSEYYTRPTYGTPSKPAIKDGHFVSECIECMRKRGKEPKRLEPWISRVKHEQRAIDYLMSKGIWTTTGKMTNAPDVDLVCWGAVWVEAKHSILRKKGNLQSFQFNTTPTQQKRGLLAHVIILMCEYPDGRTTHHLFEASNPVFYKDDGVSLKSGIIYTPGRRKRSTRGRGYQHQLIQPIMDSAKDNTGLIWLWMKRLQQTLEQGITPEYGVPYGKDYSTYPSNKQESA